VPVIAYGIRGALVDSNLTHPVELAGWIVGSAVVHDGAVAPVAIAIAFLGRRALPRPLWRPARWVLALSAVLVAIALPLVRGYGRNPRVPSLLSRNYAWGLAAVLLAVWVGAAVWGVA